MIKMMHTMGVLMRDDNCGSESAKDDAYNECDER